MRCRKGRKRHVKKMKKKQQPSQSMMGKDAPPPMRAVSLGMEWLGASAERLAAMERHFGNASPRKTTGGTAMERAPQVAGRPGEEQLRDLP